MYLLCFRRIFTYLKKIMPSPFNGLICWFYRWKFFSLNQSGIITVETAVIAPVFFVILLFIINSCWVLYLIAAIDLATVESAKKASVSKSEYENVFRMNLVKSDSLWSFLINPARASFNIQYCNKVSDIIEKKCSNNLKDPENYPIAIYEVRYNYIPDIFPRFITFNLSVKDIYIQGSKVNDM